MTEHAANGRLWLADGQNWRVNDDGVGRVVYGNRERLIYALFGSNGRRHAGRSVGRSVRRRSCVVRSRARVYRGNRSGRACLWIAADGSGDELMLRGRRRPQNRRAAIGRTAEGLSTSFTGTPTRNVRVTRRANVETGFVFVCFPTGFVVSTGSAARALRCCRHRRYRTYGHCHCPTRYRIEPVNGCYASGNNGRKNAVPAVWCRWSAVRCTRTHAAGRRRGGGQQHTLSAGGNRNYFEIH